MPPFIHFFIVFPLFGSIGFRRYDGFNSSLIQNIKNTFGGIIRFIGNQSLKIKVGDQRFALRDVVSVTTGQNKAQRIAQSVDTDVNFGTEATFAPA